MRVPLGQVLELVRALVVGASLWPPTPPHPRAAAPRAGTVINHRPHRHQRITNRPLPMPPQLWPAMSRMVCCTCNVAGSQNSNNNKHTHTNTYIIIYYIWRIDHALNTHSTFHTQISKRFSLFQFYARTQNCFRFFFSFNCFLAH